MTVRHSSRPYTPRYTPNPVPNPLSPRRNSDCPRPTLCAPRRTRCSYGLDRHAPLFLAGTPLRPHALACTPSHPPPSVCFLPSLPKLSLSLSRTPPSPPTHHPRSQHTLTTTTHPSRHPPTNPISTTTPHSRAPHLPTLLHSSPTPLPRFANGDRHEGKYEYGRRSGFGCYIWTNGDMFRGVWVKGVITGRGTKTTTGGDTYTGQWAKDKVRGGRRKEKDV